MEIPREGCTLLGTPPRESGQSGLGWEGVVPSPGVSCKEALMRWGTYQECLDQHSKIQHEALQEL